jgi:hypothetical protein
LGLNKKNKALLFWKKEAKNFYGSGSWAFALSHPLTQVLKVFLLLFVHKK